MNYNVFCDGSCINNGRPGARAGYAVVVMNSETEIHVHAEPVPANEPQTNQRAELRALLYALQYLRESSCSGTVYTDSKYAIQCVTTWGPSWKAAGWKKADKKPALHVDLIEPMLELYAPNGGAGGIVLQHVKAHTGRADAVSRGNARVDDLARRACLHL
jgi:ribonuclease HI